MSKNKNNFRKLKYLSKCDLINKYLLTDSYSTPNLQKILISISLKKFIAFVDQSDFLEKKDLNIKIRMYVLFFLFSSNVPFLKNFSLNTYSKNDSFNAEDFFLNIYFSEKRTINDFLVSLITENTEVLKQKANPFKSKILPNSKDEKSKLKLELPLDFIFNLSYLTNSSILSANQKEIDLSIDFVVSNKICKNQKNVVKSLPFLGSL
jgi:hypothetical protein